MGALTESAIKTPKKYICLGMGLLSVEGLVLPKHVTALIREHSVGDYLMVWLHFLAVFK